ncbi:hypothetical protein DV736_g4386, partial [Chaetothyriales sp. CBS 134916]
MPSSITLTVSHLPTSASFFLSALQPLNYSYRGSSGKTIGFGPTNSSAPADFWITQEIPGVPAGAAHVAFPAISRTAVHDFFAVALKAGGKVHGEPCLRDASGYYSAAVIDFDGNSIEAVYRPTDSAQSHRGTMSVVYKRMSPKASTIISLDPSSASKARSAPISRAPSHPPSAAPSRQPSPPKGDALDRILDSARNTADVARNLVEQVRPQLIASKSTSAAAPPQSHEPSDAIVGTLLGVAAGAALHYVFANRNSAPDYEEERGQRPWPGNRSTTAPVAQYEFTGESDHKSLYSRGGGKYITMEDNDYPSTVVSGASKKAVKMLNGPPSSYKAPTVITQAQTQTTRRARRSSSASRVPGHSQSSGQNALSSTWKRRSSSASRSGDGAHTVLHIKEFRRSETLPAKSSSSSSPRSQASTVKPIKRAPSTASKVSRPLPSRAATWADGRGGSEASFVTARSGGAKTILGLEKVTTEASKKERSMTRSVVGKLKDVKRLELGAGGEIGPEDSVSQVSSIRGSRRSRR